MSNCDYSQLVNHSGDMDQWTPSTSEPSPSDVLPPQCELPPSPPSPTTQPQAQPPPQSTEPLAQPPPQSTEPQAQPPPQSTVPQAQPQQPTELQYQAAVTGVLPGLALTTPAPPPYSEVIKNQQGFYPVQHVQQVGHPQYMYTQQSGVQPGVQTMPYTVHVSPQSTAPPDSQPGSQPDYPGPHTFETIAVVTATIFCLINVTSLMFGIPAVAFSQKSKDHKERGDYSAAKEYANIALSFTILNIIYVLGAGVILIGLSLGIYYQ